MALGTSAFLDLILYDIKRLHISGITFLDGGYFEYEKFGSINGGIDSKMKGHKPSKCYPASLPHDTAERKSHLH